MKRNKFGKFHIFCFIFFIIGLFPSNAISADIAIENSKNISVSCFLKETNNLLLLQSLQKGSNSKLTVRVRLFRKTEHSFSLLGDHLIDEFVQNKFAAKDIFSESFIIKEPGQNTYYENEKSFLENYFRCSIKIPSENLVIDELSAYYVKVKATLVNRLYVQPFHIFNLLYYREHSTTGWITSSLTQDHK